LDKISYALISAAVFFFILSIFLWPEEPKNIEFDPYSQFTVCHPKEDLNKSNHTLEGYITWTRDYCLVWEDFQGATDYDVNKTAFTTWKLESYSEVEVTNSAQSNFKFTEIDVVAFFDINKSWLKPVNLTSSQSLKLLRHEQGHFDLGEEHARFIENNMKESLMNKIFPFEKFSENLKSDAEKSAKKLTKEIFDQYFNRQIDEKYDKQTGNGTKWKEQIDYNLRFDKLRNDT